MLGEKAAAGSVSDSFHSSFLSCDLFPRGHAPDAGSLMMKPSTYEVVAPTKTPMAGPPNVRIKACSMVSTPEGSPAPSSWRTIREKMLWCVVFALMMCVVCVVWVSK